MNGEFLRRQIVEKSLQAYRAGLFAGTSGNMSAYCRAENIMYITPTSVRYETMRPEDVVAMRLDGTILGGEKQPSSEWRMHAAVYRAFPDTGAVFHTHSPHATAFAVVHRPIPATLIEMHFFLGGDVPCAKYARPGTDAVGENAAAVLAGKGGCLLENHGVLAVGRDLDEAYLRAEYIEDAAKIYILANTLGTPVTVDKL
mgnify:FL=1